MSRLHVVTTGSERVWLVDAENPDQAELKVREQYDDEVWVYYEGTLDQYTLPARRDGVELINP